MEVKLLLLLLVLLPFYAKGTLDCYDDDLGPGEPLLLTPYVESGKFVEAAKLSEVIYRGNLAGNAGFLSVPSESGTKTNNLYFWFQPCENCAADAPFLLWLQGGPGGASMFGAFTENGNYYIDQNCEFQKRCNSWCQNYNCLFVDQPAQTGFTYQVDAGTGKYDPDDIEYTTTSAQCGVQLHAMLKQFFQIFPNYLKNPFWVTGESYGGNYVPNVALVIAQNNQDPVINLVGVSVGDPALHPVTQWPTYADTLYGMGLLTLQQREIIRDTMDQGVTTLTDGGGCRAGFDYWNMVFNDDALAPEPFYFLNFTGSLATDNSQLYVDPDEFNYYVDWYATNTTSRAFKYGGSPLAEGLPGNYGSFYSDIYTALVNSNDWCQNSTDVFANLFVNYNIHTNIYSGTNDPILGPPTTEAGIEALLKTASELANDPSLYDTWVNTPPKFWGTNRSNLFGVARQFVYNNTRFSFPVVKNAGHEVPAFKPASALDMTNRVINGFPFDLQEHIALPQCQDCGGAPPFAGSANCECLLL